MTKEERKAYNALVKDMIAAGIAKEMAKTLARIEIEYKIVKPVIADEEIGNFKY